MPREGQDLPVIIDNLEIFSEKLLNLIADESDTGRDQLISIIESAKEHYNKPIESWIKGWFYQYTRVRGPEVDKAIKGIEAFPDAVTRLQEFKLLVGKGEWKPGSFNYYLFDELIKAVPGYQPLTNDVLHAVILRLDKLINTRIDGFMSEYKANQKLIESREKERQETHQSLQKSIDNVLLFNNLESAKSAIKVEQNKIMFCLALTNGVWKLSWLDLMDMAHPLEPSEELVTLLQDQGVKDVEKLNLIQIKRLKKECIKVRDVFLGKTQVLVNPKDINSEQDLTNEALIAQGVCSTFILRGQPNQYSLYWVNSLSNITEISLEKYPKMTEWLNATPYPFSTEQVQQLKTYLLHVNTTKPLGMDDFKNVLKNCLAKGPSALVKAPQENKIKRLDMSFFKELERCLGKKQEQLVVQSSELAVAEDKVENVVPKRLNVEKYAISKLFGHKPKHTVLPCEELQTLRKVSQ